MYMFKSFIVSLVLICGIGSYADGQIYILDSNSMQKLKVKLKAGKSPYAGALKKLLKQADSYLSKENPNVMSKAWTPPSGDKHDWLSHALYYWPDPSKRMVSLILQLTAREIQM